MKKSKLLCIVLFFVLIFCSCGEQTAESSKESKPIEKTTAKYQNLMVNISSESVSPLEDLSQGNEAYCDFALKVFKESLSKEGKNTSTFQDLSFICLLTQQTRRFLLEQWWTHYNKILKTNLKKEIIQWKKFCVFYYQYLYCS